MNAPAPADAVPARLAAWENRRPDTPVGPYRPRPAAAGGRPRYYLGNLINALDAARAAAKA